MKRPVYVAIATMLLQVALVLPGISQTPTISAPAMPELNKEQAKKLNKATRKQYERCAAESGLSAANDCLGSAVAAHNQLQEAAIEALANQRACAFGNAVGCMSYGKVLAQSGSLDQAHQVWTSGPCKDAAPCQREMFWSIANTTPPNMASAEVYGLPLCQQNDDDQVCKKLIDLGSKFDYGAVVEGRKQRYIADLQQQAGKSDLSLPLLQGNLSLNEYNVNNQTGFGQLLARGELKLAQMALSSEQKNNAKLHALLDACTGGGPCTPPPPPQTNVATNAH
jgi:hypothetical protein